MTEIEIHVVGEESYAPYIAVLLASIRAHHESPRTEINILDVGLTRASLRRLKALHPRVNVYELTRDELCMLRSLPVKQKYMKTAAAYAKCFIFGRLLHCKKRALILDADTLVLRPLTDLFATNMGDSPLGAVEHLRYNANGEERSKVDRYIVSERYFNSGVMLVDTDNLRASDLVNEIFPTLRTYSGHTVYHDQDILNIVFGKAFFSLSPVFNWHSGAKRDWQSDLKMKWVFDQRSPMPSIVHFTGEFKPTSGRCSNPHAIRWFCHLRDTPWRDLSPICPHYHVLRNRTMKGILRRFRATCLPR